MSAVGYARAAYDFVSEHPEDVMLQAGDVVQVLQQVDDSWLKGKNRNKVGYFPVTYIEPLQLPSVKHGQKLFLTTRLFQGEVDGDLSFDVGNIVIGLECIDDNWWKGTSSSASGIFPLTHVVELHSTNVWKQSVHKASASSPQIVGTKATATADLRAQLDDELSFIRGDTITILHDLGDGFAIGQSGERVGQFPLSFVELHSSHVEPDITAVTAVSPSTVDQEKIVKHPVDKVFKKSHTRQSSYTLLNTRSHDSSVAPYCSTLYPFVGNVGNGELSFRAGEIVHLLSHINEEWLYGELDGRHGIFPASYVDIIVDCTTAEDGTVPATHQDEKSSGVKCADEVYGRILYDFNPATDSIDEISVTEGDTVTVLQKCGPHWLEVKHDDGRVGLCPTSYVELFGEEPRQSMKVELNNGNRAVTKPKPPVKPKSLSSAVGKSISSAESKPASNVHSMEHNDLGIRETGKATVSPVHKSSLASQWKPLPDIKPTLNELMKASCATVSTSFPPTVISVAATSASTLCTNIATKPGVNSAMSVSVTNSADPSNGYCHSDMSIFPPDFPPAKPAMPPRPPEHKLPQSVQRFSQYGKQDLMQFSPDGELSSLNVASVSMDAEESSDGLQKHQEARDRIISELYQTELDFCSCLELCVATFDDPINSPLPAEDREILFCNINSVVALSQSLISQLQDNVMQKSPADQSVGRCFLEMKEEIQKIYAPYCRNHDIVIAILEKYECNNDIMNYINQKLVLMRQRMTVFDLSSILIKPVQRILKYPLLLSELLKATVENHCDKQYLVTAVAAMTEVAAAINEYKRRKDLVLKYKRETTDAKFSDKIGRLSVHSTKKKFFRISQKMVGVQTVDERFNSEEHRFKLLESTVRILIQDIALYVDQLEEALSGTEQMAGNVRDLYADKSSDVDEFCSAHSNIVAKLFSHFKTNVEKDVIPPLSCLLLMFQGPSNVIRKRHDKLLDFDNASKRLGYVKENDQLNSNNEELVNARANYEALNAQLLDDLPKLFSFSIDIVFEILCRLLQLQTAFHSEALDLLYSCLGLKLSLGATVLPLNIIEQFNVAHAAIVDRISSFSLIPTAFNPRAEEIRRAKPKQTSVMDSGLQTEDNKACLVKTYAPDRLFTVVQDVTGTQPYDLSLKKGSIVGIVKEVDPMGNRDRWFVDSGSSKGFIMKQCLTQQPPDLDQQKDLLIWSDLVSVSSNPPTSVLDDSSWSQELLNLLEPPLLSPTVTMTSSHTSSETMSSSLVLRGSQSAPRPASCASWETFTDDTTNAAVPIATLTHVSSAKNLSFSSERLKGQESFMDGANNNCYRVLYAFAARDSSEVSLADGTVVNVIQRSDLDGNADWWLVVTPNGRSGYAPASYLEPVTHAR